MTSSKLSVRRATARKPFVCRAPPIPPIWPPDTIWLHAHMEYNFNEFHDEADHSWPLRHNDDPNFWDGIDHIADIYAYWRVDPTTELATLYIKYGIEAIQAECKNTSIPITHGTPTHYTITEWEELNPADLIAIGDFTF